MARKMKDSGIEWIGEIPEGWEIHRMKSCISQRDGGAWGDEATGETGDCICLRIADFDYEHFRFIDSNNLTIRHYASPIIRKLLLQKNDNSSSISSVCICYILQKSLYTELY